VGASRASCLQLRQSRLNHCRRHRLRVHIADIGLLQALQILFDLPLQRLDRWDGLTACHSLELRSVDSYPLAPNKARVAQKAHKASANRLQPLAFGTSELGDSLVIGHESAQKPHDLYIAPTLRLQPSRGAYPVQVTVHVELQEIVLVP